MSDHAFTEVQPNSIRSFRDITGWGCRRHKCMDVGHRSIEVTYTSHIHLKQQPLLRRGRNGFDPRVIVLPTGDPAAVRSQFVAVSFTARQSCLPAKSTSPTALGFLLKSSLHCMSLPWSNLDFSIEGSLATSRLYNLISHIATQLTFSWSSLN